MSRRCANDAASALLRQTLASRSCRRTIDSCVASTASSRRTYSAQPKQDIAVIGGGITGLTTAYYLAKELPSTTKITIYEGSGRLGGWICTDRVPVNVNGVGGDVAFERGPRSFASLSRDLRRFDDLILYNLVLDLGLKLHSPPDGPRYIYYPDHIVRLPPRSPLEMLTEPLFRKAMWPGFVALSRYYKYKGTNRAVVPSEDLSIADWMTRITNSNTIGDNLISAIVHGVHGGDITRLSARSALDGMYWSFHAPGGSAQAPFTMERREYELMVKMGKDPLVRALAQQKRSSMMHFGPAGMRALPDALEATLRDAPNVNIKLDSPVRKISPGTDKGTVDVHSTTKSPKTYNRVVSTILANPLSKITNNKIPALENTHAVSVMTVNVWYPIENIKPPGFGYLIPRSVPQEQNPEQALGVFFDSDVAVGAANEPKGTKLFVLMGGHYYDNKTPPTEEEAVEQAKAVLERHLGIPRETPCFAMARLARDCIPQHFVGHRELMATADRQLNEAFDGHLTVAGGSFARPGALSGIRSGYDAAIQIAAGKPATGLEVFREVTPELIGVQRPEIRVRNFAKPG